MIRISNPNDIDAIASIWLSSNIDAHDFIPTSYWKSVAPLVKELFPKARIYVYEQDGVIEGFAGLMQNYLAGLFVKNGCRSKGIGKALLDTAKKDYETLSLHVYRVNTRAVDFYMREGFTIAAEGINEDTFQPEYLMAWSR